MLEMRSVCEHCFKALPHDSVEAMICAYECTFCKSCVETILNNFFVGLNIQLKGRLSETQPDNFENIYIPGFGRTFDSGNFGFGFGYNVSYLIPLIKKAKK